MSILGFIIVVSLLLGAVAWIFFVWTVRSGQYEDPEGAKYRMLEDEPATTTPTATPTSTPAARPPVPAPTARGEGRGEGQDRKDEE